MSRFSRLLGKWLVMVAFFEGFALTIALGYLLLLYQLVQKLKAPCLYIELFYLPRYL